jgi:hypothetical protein
MSRDRETVVGGGDPTSERRSPSRGRFARVSRQVNHYTATRESAQGALRYPVPISTLPASLGPA